MTDIQFILTLNKTDGTTKEAKVAVNTLYKAVTGLEGYAAAENTYYAVYVVNGIQEVVSQLNGSTIKVSLEYTYDGKPNTVSMENAIDLKVVRANYTEDFSLETADGTWKYGAVNYHWGETETFDFMLATEKISGNDGWKASGVEIKGDWISSDSMAGIAYTVTEDVHIAINLNFFGGTEGTRLTLRIGVKSSDGILYSNPSFHSNPNSNTLEIMGKVVDLKAGDTIYFIFDNEAKGVEGAYPNGRLSIDLIKSKTA